MRTWTMAVAALLVAGGALAQDRGAGAQGEDRGMPGSATPGSASTASSGQSGTGSAASQPDTSRSATSQGASSPQPAKRAGDLAWAEATKHVAVVNAGILDAATNAMMLRQITQDPRSYDADHGRLFLENIGTAVDQAEAHLAHLEHLASGSARGQLDEVRSRLEKVKAELPNMTGQLEQATAISGDAGRIVDELRGALGPLKSLAGSLHARVQFRSIG